MYCLGVSSGLTTEIVQLGVSSGLTTEMVQLGVSSGLTTEIVRLSARYGGLRISADNQISVFFHAHNFKLNDISPRLADIFCTQFTGAYCQQM